MTRRKVRWLALAALGLGCATPGLAAVTTTGSTLDDGLNFYVGYSADGTLGIDAGSSLSRFYGYVGYISGCAGTATVTGTGSMWTNSDYLYVGFSGGGTLNIEAAGLVSSGTASLAYQPGSTGTATVTGAGSNWTNSGGLYVGYYGSGTLNIQAGGQVSCNAGMLGYYPGSTGTATVTGTGSQWATSYGLYVGYKGRATLTVADGGVVTAKTLYASSSDLLGNGTITVKGAVLDADMIFDSAHGPTPTLPFGSGGALNLNVDATSILGAGYKGTGTLRIADGLTVASADGYLGNNSGSAGTATVTGTGSKWTSSSSVHIGQFGSGTLNIQAGGQVSNSAGYLADSSGSIGTATVTGTGSTWTNSSYLYVGYSGSATLNIQAGGQVSNLWGYLGYESHSTGTATVTGTGSTWKNTGLYVGYSGSGTLNIEAGGQVNNTWGYVGYFSGSTGTATVTGTGSTWTNTGLYVGLSGSGTLNIQAGGEVSNGYGFLGRASGSTGTATVTGTGSKWTNSGGLYVGDSGSGTLTVADSGLVTAQTLYASPSNLLGNGTINVNGAVLDYDLVFDRTHGLTQPIPFGSGGTLNLNVDGTGDLGAGYKGTGILRIADGLKVASTRGYLAYHSSATGTATVTGTDSTWTNSRDLHVGNYGSGTLNIQAGGQVNNNGDGYLGYWFGATGTATVTGAGSKWTNSSILDIGDFGNGTLNIQAGGQVSSFAGYLGYFSGSTGTATVTGTGSTWTNSSSLYVGYDGSGKLTVADGGKVTASSVTVKNSQSAVRLHLSGSDMLVLGDATTAGSVTNKGAINFYADAFLPAGVYTPISEYAGRAMTWSGTGAYNAWGGTWDNAAKAFLVTTATALPAGSPAPVSTGERLLFTDLASGKHVGASFATVAAGTNFSAALMTDKELSDLMATPGFSGTVLSGWDFITNFTGGQVLLSFDINRGKQDLKVWHLLQDKTWTPYAPDLQTYDSGGILSFTANQFSGYAVAGVPEPPTLALLAVGGLALIGRRRALRVVVQGARKKIGSSAESVGRMICSGDTESTGASSLTRFIHGKKEDRRKSLFLRT